MVAGEIVSSLILLFIVINGHLLIALCLEECNWILLYVVLLTV